MRNPRRNQARWALPARIAAALLLAASAPPGTLAQSTSDIADTKHNLSVSGPGVVRALTENRICIFCHTPHNSLPLSPLWNRELEPRVYSVYASPTLKAGPLPQQPTGSTKLCLSCHDGTIAMGAVLNPAGGIAMAQGTFPSGSLSNFGLDLSGHHPVSFPYHTALPNAELVSPPPEELVFGGTDDLHCTTCHDPHKDTYGRFLVKDNRYSALCTTCHQMAGWEGSAHAASTASVEGTLPRPPKTWPNYPTLGEWGCESCHTPHFAPTAESLLIFTDQPPDPFSCTSAGCHSLEPGPPHSGSPVARAALGGVPRVPQLQADIAGQIRKPSAHHESPASLELAVRRAGGASRFGVTSVSCVDCHNPHFANDRKAEAPYASGMLEGTRGVDRNGGDVVSVRYEYEVCFKCHGDNAAQDQFVPRVINHANAKRAFDTTNPSYHPVVDAGQNPNVPSTPSSFEPSMRPTTVIYCSSCHADDTGRSKGPHGSAWPPILRERYQMTDGSAESFDSYALCYRCHERASILSDAGFPKKIARGTGSGGGHSGHLAKGAPCSACHDPHGINVEAADVTGTGSHTHLINFDTQIVSPFPPGARHPIFEDKGSFSGSCTLVCHGHPHEGTSYP